MTTAFALIATYFAALGVLTLVARPYRVRLVAAADGLIRDYGHDEELVRHIKSFVASANSWRSAPIRLLAYGIFILLPRKTIEEIVDEKVGRDDKPLADWRFSEMIDCYQVSTFAVNPIFGALVYLAKVVFRAKIGFRSPNSQRTKSVSNALFMASP